MDFGLYTLHGVHGHTVGFNLTDIIVDTLIDSAKMLPLLFLAYLVIEIVEHKAMDKLKRAFANEKLGVLSGALLGLFPQCGFSIAAANLYSEKLIAAGTLAAVFISTSDEALPVVLSSPATAKYFLPLVIIKLGGALLAGYLLNALVKAFGKKSHSSEVHGHSHEHEHLNVIHPEHTHENGEHHHCKACDSDSGIFKSALLRTLSTTLFIMATLFIFNLIISLLGEDAVEKLLLSGSVFEPFVAALIGLLPSCAVSVILAGAFSEGVLSFGALAAGLCAGAGAGLAVLFKSNGRIKNSLFIAFYLWSFSALIGVVINLLPISF